VRRQGPDRLAHVAEYGQRDVDSVHSCRIHESKVEVVASSRVWTQTPRTLDRRRHCRR
jgi:hypothetical protein